MTSNDGRRPRSCGRTCVSFLCSLRTGSRQPGSQGESFGHQTSRRPAPSGCRHPQTRYRNRAHARRRPAGHARWETSQGMGPAGRSPPARPVHGGAEPEISGRSRCRSKGVHRAVAAGSAEQVAAGVRAGHVRILPLPAQRRRVAQAHRDRRAVGKRQAQTPRGDRRPMDALYLPHLARLPRPRAHRSVCHDREGGCRRTLLRGQRAKHRVGGHRLRRAGRSRALRARG